MPDPKLVLARYRRTFGSLEPRHAVQRVRAIVGPQHLPDSAEGGLAQEALAAMDNGETPTPKQMAALEGMIRMMRPAPLFKAGRPEDFDEPEFDQAFPAWQDFQKRVTPLAHCIGLVERVAMPANQGAGTGWLIGHTTLVTNRHVLDFLSSGAGRLERGQAVVRFRKEFESPDEAPVDVTGVKAIHETLDAVLLKIDPPEFSDGRQLLQLAEAVPPVGAAVVAVGYPFRDDARNPLFAGAVFGARYGVKRAAPGEVVEVSPARSSIGHDCTTLGGNSGSPIFSMTGCRVVGLHFGGSFLWRNEAVDCVALGHFIQANP